MSTTLHECEAFTLTSFAGGEVRGRCIQIDTPDGFIQLTLADAAKLIFVLHKVLTPEPGK